MTFVADGDPVSDFGVSYTRFCGGLTTTVSLNSDCLPIRISPRLCIGFGLPGESMML